MAYSDSRRPFSPAENARLDEFSFIANEGRPTGPPYQFVNPGHLPVAQPQYPSSAVPHSTHHSYGMPLASAALAGGHQTNLNSAHSTQPPRWYPNQQVYYPPTPNYAGGDNLPRSDLIVPATNQMSNNFSIDASGSTGYMERFNPEGHIHGGFNTTNTLQQYQISGLRSATPASTVGASRLDDLSLGDEFENNFNFRPAAPPTFSGDINYNEYSDGFASSMLEQNPFLGSSSANPASIAGFRGLDNVWSGDEFNNNNFMSSPSIPQTDFGNITRAAVSDGFGQSIFNGIQSEGTQSEAAFGFDGHFPETTYFAENTYFPETPYHPEAPYHPGTFYHPENAYRPENAYHHGNAYPLQSINLANHHRLPIPGNSGTPVVDPGNQYGTIGPQNSLPVSGSAIGPKDAFNIASPLQGKAIHDSTKAQRGDSKAEEGAVKSGSANIKMSKTEDKAKPERKNATTDRALFDGWEVEGKPKRNATDWKILRPIAATDPERFIVDFPNDLQFDCLWIIAAQKGYNSRKFIVDKLRLAHPGHKLFQKKSFYNTFGKCLTRAGEQFGPLDGFSWRIVEPEAGWLEVMEWREKGCPRVTLYQGKEKLKRWKQLQDAKRAAKGQSKLPEKSGSENGVQAGTIVTKSRAPTTKAVGTRNKIAVKDDDHVAECSTACDKDRSSSEISEHEAGNEGQVTQDNTERRRSNRLQAMRSSPKPGQKRKRSTEKPSRRRTTANQDPTGLTKSHTQAMEDARMPMRNPFASETVDGQAQASTPSKVPRHSYDTRYRHRPHPHTV